MKSYIYLIFTAFISSGTSLFAETFSVSGRVMDNLGKPVRDAQISIPEIQSGTYSREDGRFSFDVPSGDYV
ncbi:MAG: carboxypeptidase-like regulatory domain-containing protein, partial [Calditrichota bacterium]